MVSPPLQSASPTPSTASMASHSPYQHRPMSQQQTFSALAEARASSSQSQSHSRTQSTHSASGVGYMPNGQWRQRSEAASGAVSPAPSGRAGMGGGARADAWDGTAQAQYRAQSPPYPYQQHPHPQHSEGDGGEANLPTSPVRSPGLESGSGAARGSHGAWQAGMQSWPSHAPSALAPTSPSDLHPAPTGSVAWHPSTTGYGAAPIMGPPPLSSSTPDNTGRDGDTGRAAAGTSANASGSRRPNGESSRDRRRRGRSRARDRSRSERRDKSRADKAEREGDEAGGKDDAAGQGLELGASTSRAGRNRDVRERDRDKDRDRDKERERDDDEVITTIFVVGFPDDMSEREFQNMFTFAPGFEAATLKHPPGSIRRDGTAALLDQLHNLAAARAAASAYTPNSVGYNGGDEQYMYTPDGQYPINAQMEEALANLSLGGTTSTSSATTPSAAVSMTPSAPSGPLLGSGGSSIGPGGMVPLAGMQGMGMGAGGPMNMAGSGNMGMGGVSTSGAGTGTASAKRRQTIGFARFKTRQDALLAREVLQGKRIESLGLISPLGPTGPGGVGAQGGAGSSTSTLKAEMANKNLHAKRSNTAGSTGGGTGISGLGQASGGSRGAGQEEVTVGQMRNGRSGGLGAEHAHDQPHFGYPGAGAGAIQGRGTAIPLSAGLGAGSFANGASSGSGQSFAPSSAVSAKEAWDAWNGSASAADVHSHVGPSMGGGADGDHAPDSAIPIPRAVNGFGPDGLDDSVPPHLLRGSTSLSASTSASASAAASATLVTPSSAPNGFHAHLSMAGMGMNPLHPVRSRNGSITALPGTGAGAGAGTGAGPMSPTLSASASTKSPNSRAADSKALLALAEEQDEIDWSIGMGLGMGMGMGMDLGVGGTGPAPGGEYVGAGEGGIYGPRGAYPLHAITLAQGQGLDQSQTQNQGHATGPLSPMSANINPPSYGSMAGHGPPHGHGHGQGQRAPPLSMSMMQMHHAHPQGQGQGQGQGYVPGYAHTQGSDVLSDGGAGGIGGVGLGGRLGNPADQNPPINTLYVGNLPAISPPTHPPSYLEDSLRALFQQSPGFKRMSFRQKINGPMCFVEYEDVGFATRAIRDLYGNGVNGLVKGGIRLSYSKNSLGQRGGSHPPPATLPLPLMNAHHPHSPTMTTAIPTAMFTGLPQGSMSPIMGMSMGMGVGAHPGSVMQQQQHHHAAQLAHQHQSPAGQGQGQDAPSFSSLGLSSPPRPNHKSGEAGSAGGIKEGGLSPTAAPFKIPTDPTSPRARFAIAAASTGAAPRGGAMGMGMGVGALSHGGSSGSTSATGSGSVSGSLTDSGMVIGHAGAGTSASTGYGIAQTPRSPPSLAGSMSGLSGISGMSGLAAFPPLPGSSSAFSPGSASLPLPMPLSSYGNSNANGPTGIGGSSNGNGSGGVNGNGSGSANQSTSGSTSGSVGAMSPTFSPISPGGRTSGVSFGGWVSSGRGSIGALGGGTWK